MLLCDCYADTNKTNSKKETTAGFPSVAGK